MAPPGCRAGLECSPHFQSDHARPTLTRQRPDVRIGILAGGVEDIAGIDAGELHVVEDVERFNPQRKRTAFLPERYPLAEGHVPVNVTWPVHHVHARVADGSDGGLGKRIRVEIEDTVRKPRSALRDVSIGIANYV